MKAKFAYRDRRQKKRDLRSLGLLELMQRRVFTI
jgi:ribosomal protein L20